MKVLYSASYNNRVYWEVNAIFYEGARSRDLPSTVIRDFQPTLYLGNFFFRYGLWEKKCLFMAVLKISVINRPCPARPGYARPWRSLTEYFSGTTKYKNLHFLHNLLSFGKKCIKFWTKYFVGLPKYSVSRKSRTFVKFSYIIWVYLRATK